MNYGNSRDGAGFLLPLSLGIFSGHITAFSPQDYT